MNLTSYLQMPPAPSVPTSPSSATSQSVRPGAGFDFAQVMARQIQRLAPQERQSLAAVAPQNPEPTAREQEVSRPETPRRSTERPDSEARKLRPTEDETAQADEDSHTPTRARQRPRAANPKNQPGTDTASLLEDGLSLASVMAPPQAATPTPPGPVDNPELTAAAAPLQTIELSPQVRIITDPKAAPSPESLAAFAKSMGLDESTIQNLLGQPPAVAPSVGSGAASAAGVATAIDLPHPALTQWQANLGALVAQPQGETGATPTALAQQGATAAQQLATLTPAVAVPDVPVVSGAGLALSASTLQAPVAPGLTPTDLAAIQQVQITVLPAAVLPVQASNSNAPMPSTVDMLSLLGTGVEEKDVSALLSRFSEEAGSDGQPSEQQGSPSEGGSNFSSFSQALTRHNTAHAAAPTAAAATPNMSEVYDQLSDKMATELAARMHKQLSAGEWKMKFGLRPANLGGVEIHLEMKDGKLDAVFHADNPLTRDLLQNSSQRLREALGNFGINAGQVQVGQGGGNGQSNTSGNSGRQPQVRDNSTSQVNGSDSATSASSTRNKANASLLDLYA